MSRGRRSGRLALAGAGLLAAVVAGGAVWWASREDAPRPNLVLFTIDTWRADALDDGTTPLAARLAREGVRFTRAYTPRGQTHPSLASLLTGLYPATHGLRDNGQDYAIPVDPLPARLARVGYRTAAFCSNLDRTRWPFWTRGFEVAVDGVQGRLREEGFREAHRFQRVWDERTVDAALRWIDELPADGRPFFLWVHLFDAHDPYAPAPEDASRFVDPRYAGPLADPSSDEGGDVLGRRLDAAALAPGAQLAQEDLRHVEALYRAGVRGCDDRLARVHARLEERGLLAHALVAYGSDHGEELGERVEYFGHGCSVADVVLRVPLVLWARGLDEGLGLRAGTTSDLLVRNQDLLPTFLALAGAPAAAGGEARDLLAALRGGVAADATRHDELHFEWEDLIHAVRDERFKLLSNPGGFRPRKPPYHRAEDAAYPLPCLALYDVDDDPLELHDVADGHPDAVARLQAAIAAFLARPEHRRPMTLPDVADPDLEALGYVGTTRRRDVLRVPCGPAKDTDERGGER